MLISFILTLSTPISMLKSLKEKLLSTITTHPKLVTFAIGFAVTFTIGTVLGILEQGHLSWDAFANQSISQKNRSDQS